MVFDIIIALAITWVVFT